jgi:serine/threonine protein kinase/TolB-like protein/cytochrome c-type biogenesis protein CcmH/NrfG
MVECPKCHAENKDGSRFCSHCSAPLSVEETLPASITKTLATPISAILKDALIAGKYRIIEEVGQGGMGIVYKAEDLKLKRFVALKFVPPHLMSSAELEERFLIEAQAAAALSHPNICVIHEIGEDEARPYIAMEYVEGETLRDRIKKGPLKADEALGIVNQVAAGLGEAHVKGVVHRDIKSANIMVTAKGQAKVMDFGLAKLRGGSSLTKSQTTLGTVAYMSPEQARGDVLDERTDIWSLGVVLYEMLTGELPFKGDHDQAVIHSILHREPKPLKKMSPGLPSGLDEIVLQTLSKKPAGRYQTMEEFRADVEAVAEGLKPLKARLANRIFGIRTAYVYSALAVVLALILGLNVGGLRDRVLGRGVTTERAIRLAVIPFVNLSGDPEQEPLSDGLTQELITRLGRLHPESLGVIGRASVLRYKRSETPIDQIGRELDVEYVLEGSAQREANRVRINAELIQVRDQTQLWTETYEREWAGIFALQSDIAKQVAGALALKLLPSEQAGLANVRTVNPDAYDAYLKGKYHTSFLTKNNLDIAELYYNMAIEMDPDYAAAWAGIARVWYIRQQMGILRPSEAAAKAKEATLKALALDDTEWEAHRALASFLTWSAWDWAAAEKEFDRMIQLNPNDAEPLAGYSHFLMHMGRPDEAMVWVGRALKLDPFNAKVQSFYAWDLLYVRRYDEAVAVAREALGIQADAPVARTALAGALFKKGMFDEALALEKERWAADPELMEALEQGSVEAGFAGAEKRLADVLATRYGEKGGVSAYHLANLYVHAGSIDRALDWLEKAYEEHDPNMPYIGNPVFDSLRSEPRFQALVRKMGLPLDDRK